MNVTPGGCLASMPYGYQPRLRGPYIAGELLIALLAITGNVLVCLAVTRNRRLRTVTNYFLVSLAVADILVGLVAIPCAVLTDLGQPRDNLPLCLVLLSILMVLTQSSILSLLAVAAERYVAILLPFQYQRIMSPRNARLALMVTWSLAAISGSVPLMDWHKQPTGAGYCIFTCVVDMTYMVYFNFFCCLLVPLVAMFVIYAHIFLTVRRQLRRIAVARGTASEARLQDGPPAGSGSTGTGFGTEDTVVQGSDAGGATGDGANVGTETGSGREAKERTSKTEVLNRASETGVGDGVGASIGTVEGVGSGSQTEIAAVLGTGVGTGVGASTGTGEAVGSASQTEITTVFTKLDSRIGSAGSGSATSNSAPVSTRPGTSDDAKTSVRTRQELRKATSLFLVLFLFMVCWMPIHCINCVLLLCPQCPVPMSVTLVAILLSHANSALNPLLYAYRMRSFRRTLTGMCPWSLRPKHQ